MATPLNEDALSTVFQKARTYSDFLPTPVPDELLRQVYLLSALGPTSANSLPMRAVFVKSPQAKERLRPALMPGNVEKTMRAPVTAIIADDQRFYDFLPKLYPSNPKFREVFAAPGKEEAARIHAFRNATLGGAYLIIAARAFGLDCGPMSGFDNAKVDAEFFPDGRWKSNFLINLGYGDASNLHPRQPRLEFDEACKMI